MFEMPPMLQGTTQEQLAAMRDYLVRLVLTLEREKAEAEAANDQKSRR